MLQLLDLKKEEIVGKSLSSFCAVREEMEKIQAETFGTGRVMNREIALIGKNGVQKPCSCSTHVRKDSTGTIIGYFVSFSDLSESKKLQYELKSKLAELEIFHDAAVGRELKMIDMEKEMNAMLKEMGKEPKFK